MFLNLSHLSPLEATAAKVAALPETKAAMSAATFICCNVAGGRGELQLRKRATGWEQRTCYVDRCFGTIHQKWQPLEAGR